MHYNTNITNSVNNSPSKMNKSTTTSPFSSASFPYNTIQNLCTQFCELFYSTVWRAICIIKYGAIWKYIRFVISGLCCVCKTGRDGEGKKQKKKITKQKNKSNAKQNVVSRFILWILHYFTNRRKHQRRLCFLLN